jgi:hypothetical protein
MICLQTRQGVIHTINWITTRGGYYTECGLVFHKSDRLNLFDLDDYIENICENCKSSFTDNSLDRYRHGSLNISLLIRNIGKNSDGVVDFYQKFAGRHWNKLQKYKRLLQRRS